MKIARVRIRDTGVESYAVIRDGQASTMTEIRAETGLPVPHDILEFLFGGWIGEVHAHAADLRYDVCLDSCDLLPPIPRPRKILCAAFNYQGHAAKHSTDDARESPVIVIKPPTALCGASAHIVCPSFVRCLDYETELAVIIGRQTKHANIDEAARSVFGYMVLNDVSARDIQFRDGQFTRAKGFDTFAPCGPWITTRDEVANAASLRITTRVNGKMRQDALAGEMMMSPERMISELSRSMTLECGDIIATGTPGGTVLDIEDCEYLSNGDVVESEISGLGTLTNTVMFVG